MSDIDGRRVDRDRQNAGEDEQERRPSTTPASKIEQNEAHQPVAAERGASAPPCGAA